MLSLENKDIAQIPAGDYIIMIDPIWDESVYNDKAYREIMIDIFCPLSTSLSEVNRDFGWEIFQGALVHYARNKVPQEMRKKYLADKEDYQNCVRV